MKMFDDDLDKCLEADVLHQKLNDNLRWFHDTSRKLAELKLKNNGLKTGLFLIRRSYGYAHSFVLSLVVANDQISHYHIRLVEDCHYTLDQTRIFNGLDELVEYYSKNADCLPTNLKYPCLGSLPPAEYRTKGYTNYLHKVIQNCEPDSALRVITHRQCPDLNERNCSGSTALHEAATRGYLDVVTQLIEKGASVELLDNQGYTPLQVSCINNQHCVIEPLIVLGRADPQERHPVTLAVALHEAARFGNDKCINALLSLNSTAWCRDGNGKTPYDVANDSRFHESAKLICEYKMLPAISSKSDWYHNNINRITALDYLVNYGMTTGLFLIRKSNRAQHCYVLTLSHENSPYNYEIRVKDNTAYFIGDGPFLPSLEHLVDYYSVRADGLPTKLITAISQEGLLKTMIIKWLPDKKLQKYAFTNPLSMTVAEDHFQKSPASRRKSNIPIYARTTSTCEPLELDIESIDMGYELGQGEYGSVLKGAWTSPEGETVSVAIKTLRQQYIDSGWEQFKREAEVMVKLNHECIVKLIGISQGPPVMLVQELMSLGSMLDYLLDYPERVDQKELFLWASQIASGMAYLESKRFVHRDLAARNILLASKKQACVGDFGLSRAIEGKSNYYRASEGGRWPVKWYAPECVNYGTFSSASDVWSFGITLWEMFSYGEQPYGSMIGVQVIAYIEKGNRLEKPAKCPKEVYPIMRNCWDQNFERRMTFKDLYKFFSNNLRINGSNILTSR